MIRKYMNRVLIILCLGYIFVACSKEEEDTPEQPISQEQLILTDIDGNEYNTVTIGDQVWMAENLRTTNFNDGTAIHLYSFEAGDDWSTFNRPKAAYQWGDTSDLGKLFDEDLPKEYYGAMYNHFAIETGKLAPEGWRVPTVDDFKKLEAYVGANGHQGMQAKALKSKTGWSSNSGNGTDDFGFNGLPSGYVSTPGGATGAPVIAILATSNVDIAARNRQMMSLFGNDSFTVENNSIHLGAAIRCIKN